jgi:hypothetical protein
MPRAVEFDLSWGAAQLFVEFDIFCLYSIIRSLTSIDVSNNNGGADFAKHIADGIKDHK